jgi:hypothetical protein
MKLTPWPTPVSCTRVDLVENTDMEDHCSLWERMGVDMDSGLGHPPGENQPEKWIGQCKSEYGETELSSVPTVRVGDSMGCEENEDEEAAVLTFSLTPSF